MPRIIQGGKERASTMFRVWLKESVVDAEGYREEDKTKNGGIRVNSYIDDEYLQIEDGRKFIDFGGNALEVPANLVDFVDEITLHEMIPAHPHRERGLYRNQSAQAEVEMQGHGENERIGIEIKSQMLADARELLCLIKTGAIRPEVSFEVEQGGKSANELKAELEKALMAASDARASLASAQGRYASLDDELWQYIRDLNDGWWPFLMRGAVKARLSKIGRGR